MANLHRRCANVGWTGYGLTAVERKWHLKDSQGQSLASQMKVLSTLYGVSSSFGSGISNYKFKTGSQATAGHKEVCGGGRRLLRVPG